MSESSPIKTLPEYWTAVSDRVDTEPEWRYGQAAFNVLYEMRPELANQIRATTTDPFYRDDKMPDFVDWLEGAWE